MYYYDEGDEEPVSNVTSDEEPDNSIPEGQERELFADWFFTCCDWEKVKATDAEFRQAMDEWYPGKAPALAVRQMIERRKQVAITLENS